MMLQQHVQAMEFWTPTCLDSIEVSIKKLKKAKIYVGILGTRYGTVNQDGKSITQLEYEEACKIGIERQIYFIDENRHPITFSNVDTGNEAQKLKEFKNLISKKSVRGTFVSDDDLAKQVVTNIIELLKEEGEDIRAAIKGHGISGFNLRAGYASAFAEKSLDVSSIIEMNDESVLKFSDSYIESVAAAGVIAKNIKDGNYDLLNDFVTFHPEVYRIACFLIKDIGIDNKSFAKAITDCENSTTLRLLINMAGQAAVSECIIPICDKILITGRYHNDIKSLRAPITPFYDIVKQSLSRMQPKIALPIIERYFELSKKQKKWQAKQIFESVLKNLKKKLVL